MHKTAGLIEISRRLASVETATVGHFRTEGFLPPEIQCLIEGVRVCGPAFTVDLPGDDGTALSHTVSQARPGDILVVAGVAGAPH